MSLQPRRLLTPTACTAPAEMWLGKAYSYSADIWALGCILNELCTLRPTFLSESERTEADIKRRVGESN